MKVVVFMLKQDDPSKCTANRMAKFRFALPAKYISKDTLILNPFSKFLLCRNDAKIYNSLCVIDCSWEKVNNEFTKNKILKYSRVDRRLPRLLAGNPTNYSKLGKLSSAEAVAAALYILGNKRIAQDIMNKFKWGHTFFDLNSEPLEEYSRASSPEEISDIEDSYFIQYFEK
jgi:rRNA small subunit aminocarboxypropyltransferase